MLRVAWTGSKHEHACRSTASPSLNTAVHTASASELPACAVGGALRTLAPLARSAFPGAVGGWDAWKTSPVAHAVHRNRTAGRFGVQRCPMSRHRCAKLPAGFPAPPLFTGSDATVPKQEEHHYKRLASFEGEVVPRILLSRSPLCRWERMAAEGEEVCQRCIKAVPQVLVWASSPIAAYSPLGTDRSLTQEKKNKRGTSLRSA